MDLSHIERPPELGGGALRLRLPREADRGAVLRALNDAAAGESFYQSPAAYTSADFDAWLQITAAAWTQDRAAHWHIAAADDAYLGGASLVVDEERSTAEFGCHLAPWARGRGVAAAAGCLVRDWAFDELGLARLEASVRADNLAAQRLALAIGMRREGLMRGFAAAGDARRDYVLFGMLAGDPRAPLAPLPQPELDDGMIMVRPLEPADAPAVAAACQDPLIQQLCYYVPSPYTLADAEEFIAGAQRKFVAGTELHCAVLDAASGVLLGAVDLVHFPEREAGETGYWVAPQARGRGVATAALRLMLRYAFAQASLERVELMTEPSNHASQRVAAKAGFRLEGTLRGLLAARGERDGELVDPAHGRIDQLIYAVLRAEWEGRGA